jgi:HPt (histidine-containing phosphotransfer) domain-containing protein
MPEQPSAMPNVSDGQDRRAREATEKLVSQLSGDPDMAELVELFVGEMPERVRLVVEHFEKGQMGELKRVAHQLKGACGGYGFPQVGAAAGELEKALAQGAAEDLERVRRRVDELVELCRRVSA